MTAGLLTTVEADKVQKFGKELFEASRDAAGEKRVRKLRGSFEQMKPRLERLLRRGITVWLVLEEVFSQATELCMSQAPPSKPLLGIRKLVGEGPYTGGHPP